MKNNLPSRFPTVKAPDALMTQVFNNYTHPTDARLECLRAIARDCADTAGMPLTAFNAITGRTWLYRKQSAPTVATVIERSLYLAPFLYRGQQAIRPDGSFDKSVWKLPASQVPEEYLREYLERTVAAYMAAIAIDATASVNAALARLRRLRGLAAAREARVEQTASNAKQRAALASISSDDPTGVLSEWKPSAFDPRVDTTHPMHDRMVNMDLQKQMQRLPDPFLSPDELRYFLERTGWFLYQAGLLPTRTPRALLTTANAQYQRTPLASREAHKNPANQVRYWCYGKRTKVARVAAEPVLKYLLELVVASDEKLADATVSYLLKALDELVDNFLTAWQSPLGPSAWDKETGSGECSVLKLPPLPPGLSKNTAPPNASRPNAPPPDGIPSPETIAPPAPVQAPPAASRISPSLLADWQALMDLTDTDSPDAPRVDAEEAPAAATTGAPGDAPDTGVTASVTAPVSPLPQLSRPADWPPPDYRIDPETGVLTDYTVYPDDADIDMIWQHNGGLPLSLDDVKALV